MNMKHVIKITLIVTLISFFGSYQATAQTVKEVRSTDVQVQPTAVPSPLLTKLSDKIVPTVNPIQELKKNRLNAVKVYGLVDRNGNPLPTKNAVNQLPE